MGIDEEVGGTAASVPPELLPRPTSCPQHHLMVISVAISAYASSSGVMAVVRSEPGWSFTTMTCVGHVGHHL